MPDDEALEEMIDAEQRVRYNSMSPKAKRKAVIEYLRDTYGVTGEPKFQRGSIKLWDKMFG